MKHQHSFHIMTLTSALILVSGCGQKANSLAPELATDPTVDYEASTMANPANTDLPAVNSTAFMVSTFGSIHHLGDDGKTLMLHSGKPLYQAYDKPPCPNTMLAPFANEARVTGCTATLIAPNQVLTAAHCLTGDNKDLSQTYFVFGRTIHSDLAGPKSPGEKIEVSPDHWVRAECVSAGDLAPGDVPPDWVVVQLEQSVVRTVAPLAPADEPEGEVAMYAHPLGLPLKHISVQLSARPGEAEFDAANGNSGAALLDANGGDIIGVVNGGSHVTGARSAFGQCATPAWCPRNHCGGQPYTPVSAFANWKTAGVAPRLRKYLSKHVPNCPKPLSTLTSNTRE
ncbi:trypsin-like serine peptidase [Enhygromyxa salina]|uniref:Trypsin n=1 Tax=Enhygromyxa salina TaxID=215803 RepID=A0A2S9XN92_9BACT|nr:trypsin-like serine protease [Enhygromyxa salina]PRP94323.1 Trypsin [Enhygromyxa salina]